jgi:tetratricopeptide (TPR) repeat protein
MSALPGPSSNDGRMSGRTMLQKRYEYSIAILIAGKTLVLCATLFLGSACSAQQTRLNSSKDFLEAETLLQQHRLHEAKTATEQALQLHPSSVEGYNLLGIIDTNEQDYPSAVEAFQKALKLSPNSVKTHNNLGNLYIALKQFDSAEKEFRAVLNFDPANSDANYNLGVLLMSKGDSAAAIPRFERVESPNLPTRFNLIRAYFENKRTPEGLRLASVVAASRSNDVKVQFSLGVLLASEKQYKEAQLDLERADTLQPDTFEIIYNLGQVLMREGQYAKAELTLTRALTLKPESVDGMRLLAQAYTDESRPLDALDLLIRARRLAPDNPDVLLLMARISMSQDYFEDAIPLLEEGEKIAPRRADLITALGESYFMAGRVDKSIEQFKALLAIDDSAQSYSYLGLSYRNLGRFDEAKQYFQQGLKLDPHNISCLYNLGLIAEWQGNATDAEMFFNDTLRFNPTYPEALLGLANNRIAAKKFPEAEQLLRKYIRVSRDPAAGYYKLAMVERSLHETQAADRDLNSFKTFSKIGPEDPHPFQHLFDYLDNRSTLAPGARDQLDLSDLIDEVKRHPDQPQSLYLLADAYLKTGNVEKGRSTVAQLDQLSSGNYRALAGTGVLLARYRLYDDAIQHFQQALEANPNSDDVRFDLADAYFRMQRYQEALDTEQKISPEGQADNAYLALLGDTYAHLGNGTDAAHVFQSSIDRNPDNEQGYLSLALLDLRQGNIAGAQQTLLKGQKRIPGSGKLYWGLGVTAAMQGNSGEAARQLELAVDLLPQWSGGYSTLGVLYFRTGQITKAREVLDRFKNSTVSSSLDIERIEQVLDRASATPSVSQESLTVADKSQFLQFALSLADKTL